MFPSHRGNLCLHPFESGLTMWLALIKNMWQNWPCESSWALRSFLVSTFTLLECCPPCKGVGLAGLKPLLENGGSHQQLVPAVTCEYPGPFNPADYPDDYNLRDEFSTSGLESAEELPGQSTESWEIINPCVKPLGFGDACYAVNDSWHTH